MEAGRTTARKIPVRKAVGRGNGRGRPKTYGRDAERRARRQFLQFMICGAAFVLLVAAKLWSPEHASALRRTLNDAIDRNMDIQEVFSAVGRTFAGEKNPRTGLQEVWRAVFLPESASDAPETESAQGVTDAAQALESAQGVTDAAQTSDAAQMSETAQASEAAQSVTDAAQTSETAQGATDATQALETAQGVTESNAAQTVSGAAPDVSQTLTPYHWEGSFDNSTAFTSLSEPWPDMSASAAASVAESPSDGNAFDDTHPDAQTPILYAGRALPENVGMQQVLLNFDYQCPVKGTLTSGFGYRQHPVDGAERFHYGIDIAAETGAAIVCFADGVVTATGESTSFGKYCTVEHGGGFTTLYAHCSRVTATAGAAVHRGDKIAEVGETGQATGPHLHFALQREGIYLNPIYYVTE